VKDYCLPPNAPNIANKAKNKATGRIPITVHAVSLALRHSVVPLAANPVPLPNCEGQIIASETSLKINIPISRATAAPIKAKINPSDSTMLFEKDVDLFKRKFLFVINYTQIIILESKYT